MSGAAVVRRGARAMAGLVLLAAAGAVRPIAYENLHEDLERQRELGLLDDAGAVLGVNREPRLDRAFAALRQGSFDVAIATAREVLDEQPELAPAHEILGMALALSGEFEAALASLRAAVVANPLQSSAMTKIGDVLLALGETEAARERFLEALAVDPSDRRAHQRMGLLLEAAGDADGAVEHLEQGIVGTPPGYLGIKVNLARLYNAKGRFDDARRLLEPVVGAERADATAHVVLGTAQLATSDAALAIDSFQRARAIDPSSGRPDIALGIAYREAGRIEQSVAALRDAIPKLPQSTTAHFQLAESLRAGGDPSRAADSYAQARSLGGAEAELAATREPEMLLLAARYDEAARAFERLLLGRGPEARSYEGLARARLMAGDAGAALATMDEAAAALPDDPSVHFSRGNVNAATGRYEQAVAAYDRGLALSPRSAALLRARSVALGRLGRWDAALASAESWVAAAAGDARSQLFLAAQLEAAGRGAEAIEVYRSVLAGAPDNALALNNLAALLTEHGDAGEAVPLAERALALAPGNAMIEDTLGWALHGVGDHRAARAVLERAASRAPNLALVHYHLGVVLSALGETERARERFRHALERAPDAPWSSDARKRADGQS